MIHVYDLRAGRVARYLAALHLAESVEAQEGREHERQDPHHHGRGWKEKGGRGEDDSSGEEEGAKAAVAARIMFPGINSFLRLNGFSLLFPKISFSLKLSFFWDFFVSNLIWEF